MDYLVLPKDAANRIMVSFHYYDPSDFTVGEKQYSDWGHTGSASQKAKKGDDDPAYTLQSVYDKAPVL